MDFGSNQLYTIEAWSSSGVKLADISPLAHNRSYTRERNAEELLTFDLDIYAFEAFAASMNANPKTLINPYQTDILVMRAGQYLFGTQVVDVAFNLTNDPANMSEGRTGAGGPSSFNPTVTVTCTGYLNLFKDRVITATYSATEATTIATNLITATQAVTNGNVGVTLAGTQYATTIARDRTYSRDNVKTALQNLTQLVDGRFDFWFSPTKVFQCVGQLGSLRTDLQFTYGGSDSNVAGFYMDRSATNLYNQIIGLGSGFGADQLTSVQDDSASQTSNYLRQDVKQYNSVVLQPTLDQNAYADLQLEKNLLEIPQITITGKELLNVPFIGPGDRIPVKVSNHPFLDNINGLYRVERMVVTIDDNDFESSIVLYFDNYAVTNS